MGTDQPSVEHLIYRPQITIPTVESMPLSWPIASILYRMSAYFIDIIIQLILFTFVIFAFIPLAERNILTPRLLLILGILSYLIVFDGYFILFEYAWKGQSPGKKIFSLRVIRTDGGVVTWRECLIRQLLRYADFLPAFYSTGTVVIMMSQNQQRLGDMVAGTVVICEKKPSVSPTLQQWEPPFSMDPALLRWLNNYLMRMKTLDPKTKEILASNMLLYLHRRYPEFIPNIPENSIPSIILLEYLSTQPNESPQSKSL